MPPVIEPMRTLRASSIPQPTLLGTGIGQVGARWSKLDSEAGFARFRGAATIPVSSGRLVRMHCHQLIRRSQLSAFAFPRSNSSALIMPLSRRSASRAISSAALPSDPPTS